MKRFSLVPAFAALVVAPSARASLTPAMDLAELTETADQIVVAEVGKVECQWDKDHHTIFSTVDMQVHETWKGTPPADGKIALRQTGGAVGEIEMTVVGMPSFTVGERALLFLHKARIVGMGQGKRHLRWEATGKRWLAAPADNSTAVHVDRRGQIMGVAPSAPESLDDLRSQVRALLEK